VVMSNIATAALLFFWFVMPEPTTGGTAAHNQAAA